MEFIPGVCLITDDVLRLVSFYEQILQTSVKDINDVHVEIVVNGGGVTIYSKAASVRDMGFNYGKYCGTGLAVISFRVNNVDEQYERLKEIGVEFVTLPTTYPWGSKALHFRDPDGNIIGFVTMPEQRIHQ